MSATASPSEINCPLCETVKTCEAEQFPLLIHEFKHSYWIFGQHQFYPGYSLLILKQHARELHRLDKTIREQLWQELMLAGNAVDQIFKPWKLNYASYGNLVEHIHWHIFPRYQDDPHYQNCPFVNSDKFAAFPTNIELLKTQRDRLLECIASY